MDSVRLFYINTEYPEIRASVISCSSCLVELSLDKDTTMPLFTSSPPEKHWNAEGLRLCAGLFDEGVHVVIPRAPGIAGCREEKAADTQTERGWRIARGHAECPQERLGFLPPTRPFLSKVGGKGGNLAKEITVQYDLGDLVI